MVRVGKTTADRRWAVLPLALPLVAALAGYSAGSQGGQAVSAENVWSRPALAFTNDAPPDESHGDSMSEAGGAGGTGSVFLTLVNDTLEPERLLQAHADVAETIEIHETTIVDEVMHMRPVPHVEISAGAEVMLKPGSFHIMLIGLLQDLKVGDRFDVTLTFEKSGPMTVEAKVREP